MKLISNPVKLEKEFVRLLNQYSEYYWLTAWASSKSKAFDILKSNSHKAKKIITGLHFYQTHPDFIKEFCTSRNFKFIQQTSGVFHPKVFLFYNNDNDWELIVGSANFTSAAFTRNLEVVSLISNEDIDSNKILRDVKILINNKWIESEYIDSEILLHYEKTWKLHRSKIKKLSGEYGASKKDEGSHKPIHLVEICTMSWSDFVNNVKNERFHNVQDRINVISVCKQLFNKTTHYCDMTEDERKFIAGIPNKLKDNENIDWGYFGSMRGAGKFKNRIKENDINISFALDEIPLFGSVEKIHFENFIKHYKKVFSGNYLATATRLLAMKRPDTFVCIDSKNKAKLCKKFEIKQSGLDYSRYWDDIIERIFDSYWWKNPQPKTVVEKNISESRAAFLDALFYEY